MILDAEDIKMYFDTLNVLECEYAVIYPASSPLGCAFAKTLKEAWRLADLCEHPGECVFLHRTK